jgi:2-polyprenyl-3-methyl-5-hydroxy-6-metoxy-1,4-benzoquinol methylase
MPAPRAQFRLRAACPLCGAASGTPVWAGTFADPQVRAWIARYGYSGDVDAALADASFALVRCPRCAFAYHRDILTPEWLGTLYSRWIDARQIERFEVANRQAAFETGRQMVKHVLRAAALLGPLGRPLRWLDFGCGDGGQLAMAALFGCDAYGIDFSATRTERAGRRVVAADFAGFDALGVGEMDVVSAFQVLEHVDDPAAILRGLAARVRPGGLLVVEVPDASGFDAPTTWEQFQAVQPLEHINAFTPATLRAACERHGFAALRRPPAHVTTRSLDLLRTEASRFVGRATTNQYFRRQADVGV